MSVTSLGAVDYRSDKDRTAAYTKGARKEARKQTKLLEEQLKQQAAHNVAMLAQTAAAAPPAQTTQAPSAVAIPAVRETPQEKLTRMRQERQETKENPRPGSVQDHLNRRKAKKADSAAAQSDSPHTPSAGWYPDQVDPSLVRWFDGQSWTAHTQPRQ